MTMAVVEEFDLFGTNWRSPELSDHPSPMTYSEASNSSKESSCPSITPTPSPTTTTIPSCIPSTISSSANPFSIITAHSSTSSSATVRVSTSSERERRTLHPKTSSSSGSEHSVKGGKTAKRGKAANTKLRVLSFADVENGLSSCFGSAVPGWTDSLSELSPDRLLSMSDHHEAGYVWDETGGGAGKRTKISHPSSQAMTSWDIDGGLAADFDGSLSGLGTELGTASYNMSEALLALPVFKQENLENGFQYILGAATSPAVKMNEETLTYLNQGQSYEIKVKKLGDLSEYQGKCLRSIVRVQFHERRLQYMEKEQVDQWKANRPGERIVDVDIPLSYGLVDVILDPSKINQTDFVWDPTKETGLYFRVHAISTEFTAKKHGGEKGVPFRVQVETYTHGDGEGKLLHAASCQVKVFKPKGADRKHKTDREKMEKRSEAEKEKYQPSYECTVLTEVPLEQVVLSQNNFGQKGASSSLASSFSELTCSTAAGTAAGGSVPSTTPTPTTHHSTTPSTQPPVSSPNTPQHHPSPSPSTPLPHSHSHTLSPHSHSPLHHLVDVDAASAAAGSTKTLVGPLSSDATSAEVQGWLTFHRFSNYTRVFQHFSGADLLRLNRDDLIQICGLADGIRLNNALQSKSVRPRLTIFICQEPESVYHAIYMDSVGVHELKCKLASLFGIQASHIGDIFMIGPSSIHILVTDEVLLNTQDQSRFVVEGTREETGEKYRILLKSMQ